LKLVKMWEERVGSSGEQSAEASGQDGLVVMDVSGFSGTLDVDSELADVERSAPADFAVQWFSNRLSEARTDVESLYKDFRLSEALKTIYSLIWDDFCSWYLEWVKPAPGQPVAQETFDATIDFFTELMELLHPFMPFITEEIYQLLTDRTDDLCVRQYKVAGEPDSRILETGRTIKEVITGIRDARNRSKLKQKDEIKLYIVTDNADMYMSAYHILAKQLNANSIAFNTEARGHHVSIVIGKDKFFIETSAPIDNSEEKEGLLKELKHLEGFMESVDKKLSNERFVQNAKPEVVALEKKKRSDAETKIRVIRESLSRL
jgi:valyl-tRNA synthetase